MTSTILPSPPYHGDLSRSVAALWESDAEWRDLSAIDVRVDDRLHSKFTHRYVVSAGLPDVVRAAVGDDVFLVPLRAAIGWPRPERDAADLDLVISSVDNFRQLVPVRGILSDETEELRALTAWTDAYSLLFLELTRDLLEPGLRIEVSHSVPPLVRDVSAGLKERQVRRFTPGAEITIELPYGDYISRTSPHIAVHAPAEMTVTGYEAIVAFSPGPLGPIDLADEWRHLAHSLEDALTQYTGHVELLKTLTRPYVYQLLGNPDSALAITSVLEVLTTQHELVQTDLRALGRVTGQTLTVQPLEASLRAAERAATKILADGTPSEEVGTAVRDLSAHLRDAAGRLLLRVGRERRVADHDSGHAVNLPRLVTFAPLAVVLAHSNAEARETRTRTAFSLWAVGTILSLLFLRLLFQVRYEWPPILRNDGLAGQIRGSQEAIVALLVIFPSLLFAQVERIGRRNLIEMRTNSVALVYLFAALFAPVGCAALVVGHVEPAFVLTAFALAGVGTLGLGGLAWYTFSGKNLAARSQRVAQVAAEQWCERARRVR